MTTKVSFDGVRLLALAEGRKVPYPFHLRWLLPKLYGNNGNRWRIMQVGSFVAVSLALGGYTHAWAAMLVPLGLAGVYRLNVVEFPILTDLPAMAFGLCAAVFWADGGWWRVLALACVLIAGMCKETAPVFAACWAWSPWLLVGLAAPLVRACIPAGKVDPASEYDDKGLATGALTAPWRTALVAHKELWKDPWLLLAPWGILLVGFAHPSAQVVVTCALAYGQLLVATDLCRLYQWAFPVLALGTFHTIPARWWWLAVLVHLANPAKTGGL